MKGYINEETWQCSAVHTMPPTLSNMQTHSAVRAAAGPEGRSLSWRTAPAGTQEEPLQAPLPQHAFQDGGVGPRAQLHHSERAMRQHSGNGCCTLAALQGSAARQAKRLRPAQLSRAKAGIVSRYVLLRAGQTLGTQDVAFDRLHVLLHDAPCDT